MSRFLVALIILGAIALVACGGDDDANDATDSDPGEEATSDETELAESLLLTADDFPAGWTEQPADEESDAFAECEDEEPEGKTAEAETGSFVQDSSVPSINEMLALFENQEQALDRFDRIEPLLDCLVSAIEDGALDDEEARFSAASYEEIDVVELGQRSLGYRLTFTVEALADDAPLEEAEAYFELIYVVAGRAGLVVGSFDVFSPFPTDELEDLAVIAAERAEAGTE